MREGDSLPAGLCPGPGHPHLGHIGKDPAAGPGAKLKGCRARSPPRLLLEKHQLFLKQSTSLSPRKSILVKARGLPPGPSSGSLSRLFLAVPFSTPAMEREEASVSLGRRCDLMAPRPWGPHEAQAPKTCVPPRESLDCSSLSPLPTEQFCTEKGPQPSAWEFWTQPWSERQPQLGMPHYIRVSQRSISNHPRRFPDTLGQDPQKRIPQSRGRPQAASCLPLSHRAMSPRKRCHFSLPESTLLWTCCDRGLGLEEGQPRSSVHPSSSHRMRLSPLSGGLREGDTLSERGRRVHLPWRQCWPRAGPPRTLRATIVTSQEMHREC